MAWLSPPLNAQAVVEEAAAQGIALSPVSRFSLEPSARQGLVFGFAEFTPKSLQTAAGRLAVVLSAP